MQAKEYSEKFLREFIKRETEIYTYLDHVSRSGMYRTVKVFVVREGRIVEITSHVANVIGSRYDKRHYGIGVGGCGFDAGYDVVDSLSHVLFNGNPNKLKQIKL